MWSPSTLDTAPEEVMDNTAVDFPRSIRPTLERDPELTADGRR